MVRDRDFRRRFDYAECLSAVFRTYATRKPISPARIGICQQSQTHRQKQSKLPRKPCARWSPPGRQVREVQNSSRAASFFPKTVSSNLDIERSEGWSQSCEFRRLADRSVAKFRACQRANWNAGGSRRSSARLGLKRPNVTDARLCIGRLRTTGRTEVRLSYSAGIRLCACECPGKTIIAFARSGFSQSEISPWPSHLEAQRTNENEE